jgi:hypothetical protein
LSVEVGVGMGLKCGLEAEVLAENKSKVDVFCVSISGRY